MTSEDTEFTTNVYKNDCQCNLCCTAVSCKARVGKDIKVSNNCCCPAVQNADWGDPLMAGLGEVTGTLFHG